MATHCPKRNKVDEVDAAGLVITPLPAVLDWRSVLGLSG